jgi:hypothetical protein
MNLYFDKKFSFSFLMGLGLPMVFSMLVAVLCVSCSDNKLSQGVQEQQFQESGEPKQKGVHVFGRLDSQNIEYFVENNMEWITFVPYAGQSDYDSPDIRYQRGDSLRRARREAMWYRHIAVAKEAGLKVFLKPHLWLGRPSEGKWRSDIFPSSEENWKTWSESYRDFIFYYADLAEQEDVEMFCIGTEFTRLTLEKEEFWRKLIKDVRKRYSGKITYAANWYNEYEKITFWKELDYIGVQAYFPLVKKMNPDTELLAKSWNKYIPDLQAVAKKNNRKILFTELGYKSTADSAIEPWGWIDYGGNSDRELSLETQSNCYESFFKKVWKQEWFAGVNLWQMRSDFGGRDPHTNIDFTPQGKPAMELIAKEFGNSVSK